MRDHGVERALAGVAREQDRGLDQQQGREHDQRQARGRDQAGRDAVARERAGQKRRPGVVLPGLGAQLGEHAGHVDRELVRRRVLAG